MIPVIVLNLHCTFLYGCVNQTERESRPPLNSIERLARKQVAVALARRLPEAVTPMGTIVIEGCAGDADWLSPEDLVPILDELNTDQTHIFSTSPELEEHPYIKYLIDQRKVVTHKESLAHALVNGEKLGILKLDMTPEEGESTRRIHIEGESLIVPKQIWNQTTKSAVIVDDLALAQPKRLSDDALYLEFRNFLSAVNGRPPWLAYGRGFAFRRHFEEELYGKIRNRLSRSGLQDTPLILHGQTGTGKSVALGRIAYKISKDGKFPVLFIEQKNRRPQFSDVDLFCRWSEEHGARACLVVWDGNLESSDYSTFLRRLSSRGRKVVLVGSCYKIEAHSSHGERFVQAPAGLQRKEAAEFTGFLEKFLPNVRRMILRNQIRGERFLEESFLVALYRLLPPTRIPIRSGVSREVSHAEQLMTQRIIDEPTSVLPNTVLAHALLDAGVISPADILAGSDQAVDIEETTSIQDMTRLVMVPGRFGIRIPFELLLRTLGGYVSWGDGTAFRSTDIFSWFEDHIGNIDIGPRSPLEAELITRDRLGGAQEEVSCAKRLLIEIKEYEDREVNFAVDLVRMMGSQGRDRPYFAPYFRELSENLRELREERGVRNPRLMLQEANLLREWAVIEWSRIRKNALVEKDDFRKSGDVIHQALADAEGVVHQALVDIEKGLNRSMRAQLLVERATGLATRSRHILETTEHTSEAISLFDRAIDELAKARTCDATNYYPIDVWAWASRDMLDGAELDPVVRAEVIANVLHVIQTAPEDDFESEQQDQLHRRRLEFAQLLGDEDMGEDAFTALLERGSTAGYYLRAYDMAGLSAPDRRERDLTSESIAKRRKALLYLEEQRENIIDDARCLDLLLDLWWTVHTGTRLLDGERVALSLSNVQWKQCLAIIGDLEATDQSHRPIVLSFLKGLGLFHIGWTDQAVEVFREVEQEAMNVYGRRRVIRSYLASTESGVPRKFYGNVMSITGIHEGSNPRGEVFVEGLQRRIPFFARDFSRPDIARGEPLGEFHIAFNFLGPIADPVINYRPR